MTRHDTHGIYCQDCHVMHAWTELDKTIISDGEGGLIWIWSCPVWAGVELRREPFVFPRDMPGIQEPSEGKNAAGVPTNGLRGF